MVSNKMWLSWTVLGTMTMVLGIILYSRGGTRLVGEGFQSGGKLFVSILPSLVLAFCLAGMLQVAIPQEAVARWLGRESGLRGILIGAVAGTVTPGGPFTHFPILASLLLKGVDVGPICAYIAAWSLLGLNRFIVWEITMLGPRLALARFAASLVFPVIIGWLAAGIYRRLA